MSCRRCRNQSAAAGWSRNGNNNNCRREVTPLQIHSPCSCRVLSSISAVTGQGAPNADILVRLGSEEIFTTTDSCGHFRARLNLEPEQGFNLITVDYTQEDYSNKSSRWFFLQTQLSGGTDAPDCKELDSEETDSEDIHSEATAGEATASKDTDSEAAASI